MKTYWHYSQNRGVREAWFFKRKKIKSKIIGCPECGTAVEAFGEFTKEGLPCTTIVVDCSLTKEICKKYDFAQLPAILLFNGELAIFEYEKPYVYLEALISFVNEYNLFHKIF